MRKYTDKFLLSELWRFVDEFGKVPGVRDLDNTTGYPSSKPYKNLFGTYNNAVLEAGLTVNTYHDYTKESLIADLQKFTSDNGRIPYYSDITRRNGYCSGEVYVRVFGNWNSALYAADLDINKIRSYDYSSNMICIECGKLITDNAHLDKNDQIICETCHLRHWRKDHPKNYALYRQRRRGYGFNPINDKFEYSNAHHLHLENNSDFTIYIPEFLHSLHGHQMAFPETMDTMNSIALDYFLNESLYTELYLTGDVDGT